MKIKLSVIAALIGLFTLTLVPATFAGSPVMVNDNYGNFYKVWHNSNDNAIYFNHSADYGVTWQPQDTLLAYPDSSFYSTLKLKCDNSGHVYLAWLSLIDGNKFPVFFHSADHGENWDSRLLNLGPSGWWLGNFNLDNDQNGNVCFVSNGDGSFPTGIYANCSQDYGATWFADYIKVNSNDPSPIRPQTEANICIDENGHDYAAWSDARDGGAGGWRYIYFNSSMNYGRTWQTDQRLQPPQYAINAGSPRVNCANNGEVTVIWNQFDGQLYTNSVCSNHSSNYGQTWDGLQCVPAGGGGVGGTEDTSIYQDFEYNNGSDQYGWGFNGAYGQITTDQVHDGVQAWKVVSPQFWGGTGLQSQSQRWDMNFHPEIHDRLSFWIYAIPSEGSDNDVGVRFFDQGKYSDSGFEVWTTEKARYEQWTEVEVLFSQLPADFDLTHVNKIEVINYWPGIYFIDDIRLFERDRNYQTFEDCLSAEDCGWTWDGAVSLEHEIVHEGQTAWKLVTTGNWAGTGIRSQEKKYDPGAADPQEIQTFWRVDLSPDKNDRLTFWVYALPENGMDNNLAVQFFDHDNYFTDPVVLWTTKNATTGQWTKLTVPFADLPPDLNLRDINKIQFQVYWPGTYYFDDIRAGRETPVIDKSRLPEGVIEWSPIDGTDRYELQYSEAGPDGPWLNVDTYNGTGTITDVFKLTRMWLRVRWIKQGSVLFPDPYLSDWSEPIEYLPPLLTISQASLATGDITWQEPAVISIPISYEVEAAPARQGPWTRIYRGPQTVLDGGAEPNVYYRVRAVSDDPTLTGPSEWSPAIAYEPNTFLRAGGKAVFTQNGLGKEIILNGVNLGNLLLIEPEFVGIGGDFTPDNPFDDDDNGIREELTERFGALGREDLLALYQDRYLQEYDLDQLFRLGINFIRLPIYYKAVQDEAGRFTNFSVIDRILNHCADRGLYVLLDLHGAPGAQSKEVHSGQAGYNRLFEDSEEGLAYRNQTLALWQALASRYKDNTTVMGYDLLNEPFGAAEHDPTFVAANGLWTFYNQLYQAIRAVDPGHIIVMESIPSGMDWDTLPPPSRYGWSNVVYQFHYYGFTFDEQGKINGVLSPEDHRTYIADKIDQSRQNDYQVPVLVGEFNGFDQLANWESYLRAFARQHWSSALWSYKAHPSRGNWGLFVHADYNDDWPLVETDDELTLAAKFSKYDTLGHHTRNSALQGVVGRFFTNPWLANRTADVVTHQWHNVLFKEPQGSAYAVMASIESYNGSDTAAPRLRNVTTSGFEVKIEEEQSKDQEIGHLAETVSYWALKPGAITNAQGVPIGESGIVSVTQKNGKTWFKRNLIRVYNNPVVFMQILTINELDPCHTRIRKVTGSSFEFQLEEWDYQDQAHAAESVAYVVLEQGVHQMADGTQLEAGTVQAKNSTWVNVAYTADFLAAPVALSHCQTYNGSQAVVTRQRNVARTGLDVKLQEEEGRDQKHNNEIIGYLAVE